MTAEKYYDTKYYDNGEYWRSDNCNIKKRKAYKDIHVFIVCKNAFNMIYSQYENFVFQINEIKHTSRKLDKLISITGSISRGIVSYHKNTKIIDINDNRFNKQFLSYNKHKSFKLLERNHTSIRKLECIIPKGAYYYLNEYGVYVSDSIIPLKITKF